jgi:hypothetical protein
MENSAPTLPYSLRSTSNYRLKTAIRRTINNECSNSVGNVASQTNRERKWRIAKRSLASQRLQPNSTESSSYDWCLKNYKP